jgi:hypothetical protein
MSMGRRSTVLVFVLAIGAMFALLSSSMYAGVSAKEKLIQELQVAKTNANLARMIKPENICFTADKETIDRFPSLAQGIEEADGRAEEDMRSNSHYGNYYMGTGVDLDKSQMLSMIRTYNFNQTTTHDPSLNEFFTYQNRHFTCGFNYADKHYLLTFFFSVLEQVNADRGYVPIHIGQRLVERGGSLVTNATTYVPFNNTAVFFNELPLPVTIEVSSKDGGVSEIMTMPPGRMQDLHLSPDWASLENTNYHYKAREYPWIEGDISVSQRYSNGCMSREAAESLYAQSDFRVKFPSYVPEGFSLGCIAENTGSSVIQIYVNQTAIDHYKSKGILYSRDNPYPFYLYSSMAEEEVMGIVQVHAQKYYLDSENPREQAYETYQYMLNNTERFRTNPQFFDDDVAGISYLAFNEGRFLSSVDVLTSDESYRIVGALSLEEAMKIAKSLSRAPE